MEKGARLKPARQGTDESAVRKRILDAAFSAFMESGYAETSTLEIATRAQVSKRALYALVGYKQDMLAACITERATRLRLPADLPEPVDGEGLKQTLTTFGAQLLREVSDPTVIAVFRLAIAEAVRAPEVAQALDAVRADTTAALTRLMIRARSAGLLKGRPAEMAEHFSGLLWGNLMVSLMLRVVDRPSARDISQRAREASAAFVQLYGQT